MSVHIQQTEKKGLIAAINDFLKEGDGVNWKIEKEYLNNNGLTILKRQFSANV